ncbi:MAG: hypothetical protein AYK23_02210 [Candidatus Proteinoplasmatales archaeon SG8-5]|nr:MAG: hypothetical protein AYK23_02210 [Candidatus Proteinoplasmatales archaeon SG8-5]
MLPENSTANATSSRNIELELAEVTNLTVHLNIRPNATGNVTVNVDARYFYGDEQLDPGVMNLDESVSIYLELRPAP